MLILVRKTTGLDSVTVCELLPLVRRSISNFQQWVEKLQFLNRDCWVTEQRKLLPVTAINVVLSNEDTMPYVSVVGGPAPNGR